MSDIDLSDIMLEAVDLPEVGKSASIDPLLFSVGEYQLTLKDWGDSVQTFKGLSAAEIDGFLDLHFPESAPNTWGHDYDEETTSTLVYETGDDRSPAVLKLSYRMGPSPDLGQERAL